MTHDTMRAAAEALKEARKIIRASSSRNLAKDWDQRATEALAAIRALSQEPPAAAPQTAFADPRNEGHYAPPAAAPAQGEREAFEAWLPQLATTVLAQVAYKTARREDGLYRQVAVEAAWRGFQAGRATLPHPPAEGSQP